MTRFVKSLLLVLSVGLIFFSSCKKEELVDGEYENPTPPVNNIGKMSCFTKEAKWEAKTYYATVFNNMLTFYGVGEKNDTIEINVLLNDNDTYYEFSQTGLNYGVYTNRAVDTIGYKSTKHFVPTVEEPGAPAGNINFSDLDITNKLISGTFAFRVSKEGGSNQYPITEGKFVNLKISPYTLAENKMTAKVNGSIDAVCSSVTALRNLSDKRITIAGGFETNNALSITFIADTISAGDTLSMNSSTYGTYYDGTQNIISHNGQIIINAFDTIAKVIKVSFDYSYNGTTVENGVADVTYLDN